MSKMERLNRLIDFWDWLPFFRAVAETEHLTEAAEIVHKSPSAVSRAIQLLEEDLGCDLFERKGRNIELNERGKIFLQITRSAMRQVDEGLRRISSGSRVGEVILSTPDYFSPLVSDVIEAIYRKNREFDLQFDQLPLGEVTEPLLKGNIDLLLTHEPPKNQDEIEIEKLAELGNQINVPASVQLDFESDWWRQLEFVSFDASSSNTPIDGWPREYQREISISVDKMESGLHFARKFGLAIILPKIAVEQLELSTFQSANPGFLEKTSLYGVRRRRVVEEDHVDVVLNSFETLFA